ncbi:Crp/Fnr family transcriptional regulator [Rhodocytophaga rosea]|uniref:Crp/Fnr family transcriptional regulator n=1 Tax=Rhodocytophaga rosea TaxID=2704465 RepID=A0A6C0GI24_9BACT|nr:Crp/Fnr family transcriptional regulator [Rhodocytophaga rosea]QHT67711.1 Crp/Fnr family transcriptional regulator [Rhodocytophaga rosea]
MWPSHSLGSMQAPLSTLQALAKARSYLDKIVPLSDEEWEAFASEAKVKTLQKKEHFLRQGEICTQCAIIIQGYVRHYYLVDGREVSNDFNFESMATGAYHSYMAILPARFNIVSMEPVTLVCFSRSLLLHLFDQYPKWQKIGRIMIEGMFNRKTLREESFLLDSPEIRYRNLLEKYPQMLQRVPLLHIASYLGITPETLSRIRSKQA